MSSNNKRPRDDSRPVSKAPPPEGPFIAMFTSFRNELDEHHDRRERVIKASRDITALSKKMIFTLQRMRTQPTDGTLPPHITSDLATNEAKIQALVTQLAPDLQDINAYRYQRQVSGGIQEYIEALSFRHYLLYSELITMNEVQRYISGSMGFKAGTSSAKANTSAVKEEERDENENESVKKHKIDDVVPATAPLIPSTALILTHSDYILGLFDLVGEIMRFAITSIATTPHSPDRTAELPVLGHLRDIRLAFEGLDTGGANVGLGKDVDKKMGVMRTCVEKVEVAMYGMVVRGRERPEGWVMEVEGGGSHED